MESCELVYQITYNPFYRCSQFFTMFASISAIFPLFYLAYFKLRNCNLNDNIKFLYMLYFSQILVSVINNVVVFGHHVIIPFIAESKCDLLVDPLKNRVLQSIGVFGISGPMLTILGITFERFVALVFARYYEHARLHIGVLIGVIAIFCDMTIIYFFFQNERFDQPSISYFMVPDTSGYKMNILCSSLFVLNLLNLLCNYGLVSANTRLRKKWRNSLSYRYQMEENIFTTKFSTFISFCHVLTFFIYLCSTLFIRLVGPKFLTTTAYLMSIRGMYISIPSYNLLIGFLSCYMLRRLKNNQHSKVNSEVSLPYTGSEGAKLHEKTLMDIWNTKSSTF